LCIFIGRATERLPIARFYLTQNDQNPQGVFFCLRYPQIVDMFFLTGRDNVSRRTTQDGEADAV
jgi:hypothetical protein